MPFSAAEDERGARLIGADRATWFRLGVAVTLGVAAIAGPTIAGTAAAYTDSTSSTVTVSTADDFDPTDDANQPALDTPAPSATPSDDATPAPTESSVAPDPGATDD